MSTLPEPLTQPLWTKKQAADYLSISLRTLDRVRDLGAIGWVEVGGQIRFEPEEIRNYVKRHTKAPQP